MAHAVSHRRPRFEPKLLYVRFVVDKVTQGQVYSAFFGFCPVSIIPPTVRIYSNITDTILNTWQLQASLNNALKTYLPQE